MAQVNFFKVCYLSVLTTAVLMVIPLRSIANETDLSEDNFTCPDNVKELTTLLLKDLPAYSNRVIQRTQAINQAAGIENYIITASEAEFEPLDLPRLQYETKGDRDPDPDFNTKPKAIAIQNKFFLQF